MVLLRIYYLLVISCANCFNYSKLKVYVLAVVYCIRVDLHADDIITKVKVILMFAFIY